jgi:two-component system, NarL family, sensor histidine kinase UhpB
MTLRARLMLWIGLVLIASLLLGGVLVYWHAVRKVDVEMHAAIEVGEHTIRNAVDDVEGAATPLRQLELLVADLDGDRHLRAMLIAPDGSLVAHSTPSAPSDPAPGWFYSLFVRAPHIARINLAAPFNRYGTIVLETDSHNEISEVWSDVVLTLAVLSMFCLLSAALVFWTTGRALRPLGEITSAFARIGDGDYALRLPELGPRELAQLRRGFNRMVERLGDMERRKLLLEEQLVGVQEEERSELARDLHDEIGPLLFAVSVDLAALQEWETLRTDRQAQGRLEAALDAVASMQQRVKAILGHLRPPTIADLGLSHSIQRLVAFWETRYPRVSFEVSVPEDSLSADIGVRVYRVVQESISNALRHGSPGRIDVNVVREDGETLLVQVSDDGRGFSHDPQAGSGMGLRGMRERVTALGGELSVSAGEGGRGVTVSARLPMSAEADSQLDLSPRSKEWLA